MELRRLQELGGAQDLALDQIDVSETRRRVLEGIAAPPRRARWSAVGVLVAAAAVVAGLWLFWPSPLSYQANGRALEQRTWWTVSSEASEELVFGDGTRFLVAPDSRVQVDEVSAAGAHVMVGSGTVWAHVRPRPGARWTVSLGPYRVRVTGTIFEASWSPDDRRLDVGLVEGGMTILGPRLGTGLTLKAGERMEVAGDEPFRLAPLDGRRRDVATPPTPSAHAPAPTSAPAVASAAPTASAVPAASASSAPADLTPRWMVLARAKRYVDALAAARALGWDSLCASEGAAELMALADLARFAGDGAASRQALLALRTRFQGDPLAARAAFLLGRAAYAGQSGDWGAVWFSAYLAEAPRGPLAAEAMGRLIEAHRSAGQGAEARAAADRYLSLYPQGPYAPQARDLVEEKP